MTDIIDCQTARFEYNFCKPKSQRILRLNNTVQLRSQLLFRNFISNHINSFAQVSTRLNLTNRSYKCNVCFADDETDNASSQLVGGDLYQVCINNGLLNSMLTKTKKYIKKYKLSDCLDKITSNLNILELDTTKYSSLEIKIINLMMIYVALHEVGHIISGHCDDSIEFPNNYKNQAIEEIADYYAFNASFGLLDELAQKDPDTILMYAQACIIIWSIFARKSKPMFCYKGEIQTHPHPFIRFRYMISWLKEYLENECSWLSEEEKKSVLEKCESLFIRIHTNLIDKIIWMINTISINHTKDKNERVRKEDKEIDIIENQFEEVFNYFSKYAIFKQ